MMIVPPTTAPFAVRIASIAGCTLVASLYLVLLVSKLPPITARFIASIPVLYFCFIAPLSFTLDEVITRAIVAFTTTWLLVFKTLALALDRGALVHPGLDTWQRVAFGVLPLSPALAGETGGGSADEGVDKVVDEGSTVEPDDHTAGGYAPISTPQRRTTRAMTQQARVGETTTNGKVAQRGHKAAHNGGKTTNGSSKMGSSKTGSRNTTTIKSDPTRTALQLLSRFYTKVSLLWLIVHAITQYTLPPVLLTICYGFGLYCFLGVLMDGPGTLLTWALGVSIAPHFRSPYAATSLSNLWGKRWNLTASAVLRSLLYDPLIEGTLVKQQPPPKKKQATTMSSTWRRPLASLLCFTTSALMHEVLWWYITGHTTPHYMWFWFFTVHGVACVAEVLVLRVRTWPVVVRWLWTMAFFVVTGHLLFVPPAERAGVAGAVVANLSSAYAALGDGLVSLYARPVGGVGVLG